MRISKSTKTSVTASEKAPYRLFTTDQLKSKLMNLGFNPYGLDREQMISVLEQYDEDIKNGKVDACGDIKGSTSTDKALQHIKAAIDILGKSGNNDAVTKDSIANLGVVMFDIKANKQN